MSVLRPPRPEIWLRKVFEISRTASIFQMALTFLFLEIAPKFFFSFKSERSSSGSGIFFISRIVCKISAKSVTCRP